MDRSSDDLSVRMAYQVKELFYTLQGEGVNVGRPSVFCRFAGCNLWSGREEDRAEAACRFCDTDFVGTDGPGGGRFADPDALALAALGLWPAGEGGRFIVCTGGEPLLQLNAPLIAAFHRQGFTVAIETNGTLAVPDGVDWICVSPKAGNPILANAGDELKLVFPQAGIDPADLLKLDFDHFLLQPMDGADQAENIRAAIAYCQTHPAWRLSLQTHKWLGIP
jgi:7-carboxy-7-deazaguanine synthase